MPPVQQPRDGFNIAQAVRNGLSCTKDISQVLEPAKYPTHVILDNGCTKSMGSWYAVERFVHAVRESGNPNITCWYETGDTTFTHLLCFLLHKDATERLSNCRLCSVLKNITDSRPLVTDIV